tara:strand:+ start:189 stop:539 length:351 start_codon:yes stop_codon:yes gene_type:complete
MPRYHAVPCTVVIGPLAILLGEVPVIVVVVLSVSVPVMAPFALPTLAIVVAIVTIVIVAVVPIALGAVFELHQIEVPIPLHAVVSQGEWGRWGLARAIEPEFLLEDGMVVPILIDP